MWADMGNAITPGENVGLDTKLQTTPPGGGKGIRGALHTGRSTPRVAGTAGAPDRQGGHPSSLRSSGPLTADSMADPAAAGRTPGILALAPLGCPSHGRLRRPSAGPEAPPCYAHDGVGDPLAVPALAVG